VTSTQFLIKRAGLRFPFAFLDGDEHFHLSRVLRVRPGRKIWLLDEQGVRYRAEVQEVEEERTKVLILEREKPEEQKIHLTLAQALLKSKKMDLVVQKSTELGVASLIPVQAARSVVRLKEEQKRVARWKRIASEAAKQSRRSSIPIIFPPQLYLSFLGHFDAAKKLILSERAGRLLREILVGSSPGTGQGDMPRVIILVGPEGGWTPEEESQARSRGFEPVSLGKQVLRSETAALAALSLIAHFWNT